MGCGVGTDLRQARERAHLTLQDLAARTKIRVSLLDALEREQFERLPAGLLTRGFLRAYAREVGLDPEATVRQYVAEFDPEHLPLMQRPRPELEPEPEWGPPPGGRARWAFVVPWIPIVLAAVFFLRVQQWSEVPRPALPEVPVPIATAGERITPAALDSGSQDVTAASDLAAAQTPAVQAAAAAGESGFRVDIHPAGEVWVEAFADNARVLYDLVPAGERRTLTVRRELVMRVGDAAAFTYAINGVAGTRLGGPGQVRDVRITSENYSTFQAR